MKKTLLIIAGVIIIGGGAWLVANITSAPPEVPQTDSAVPVTTGSPLTQAAVRGSFKDQDAVHKGSGQVTIADGQVRLADDFSVTDGPDLYVYLSTAADGKNLDGAVSLGKLKSNKGAQTYTAPADYSAFKSVVVYCRAFKITFSVATLNQ